jgi:hypothetical protein
MGYLLFESDDVRTRLLAEALTAENLWDIVDIAKRHNYPEIIEFILHQVQAAAF